jgi:hypothetical protein
MNKLVELKRCINDDTLKFSAHHMTLSKLIYWYNILLQIKKLKKKIEHHILHSTSVLHNVLFKH